MDQLSLEIRDGIAVITFSNPPLQVMTPATLNELNRMLPDLRSDDVRAIVFTGSDSTYFIRHFSVEELDENARGGGGGWDRPMVEILYELEHLPKPFICALHGSAAGGGLGGQNNGEGGRHGKAEGRVSPGESQNDGETPGPQRRCGESTKTNSPPKRGEFALDSALCPLR